MEARLIRAAFCAATLLSLGASYRTQNFIVTAPSPHFAQQVALAAENYRRDLAVEWLGKELPPWGQPCPIRVDVGANLGAGGATSFAFHGGQPMDWTMSIQGSPERVLDSVLPHEITHTIFATHFGRPLPRWADEGACTTVEHESEKYKQHRLLYEFLQTGRGIAFNHMYAMTEYPPDVLPLYAQGYSLARFLIAQGGKRKFVNYVGDGMRWNNWTRATQTHYSFNSLSDLQVTWLDWVRRGSPPLAASAGAQLASQQQPASTQLASLQPSGAGRANTSLASHTTEPAADSRRTWGENQASSPSAVPNPPAAKAPATGWYARVRDENAQQRRAPVSSPAPQHALHDAVSQALSRGNPRPSHPIHPGPAAQVLTRPQPPQRAEQRVLEW